MKVLFVASECAPFVKTGGLADVVGAVPKALEPLGVDVRILLPAYPALADLLRRGETLLHLDDLFGGPALCHADQFIKATCRTIHLRTYNEVVTIIRYATLSAIDW